MALEFRAVTKQLTPNAGTVLTAIRGVAAGPRRDGPQVVEIDMVAIGPFAESFSGPPAGAAGTTV